MTRDLLITSVAALLGEFVLTTVSEKSTTRSDQPTQSGAAVHVAQELIKNELAQVEKTLRALPDLQPDALRQAVEMVVSSGGKRFRPVIALLVAGMLEQTIGPRAIHLAGAVEMLHTATLVHDDLIDGANLKTCQVLSAINTFAW